MSKSTLIVKDSVDKRARVEEPREEISLGSGDAPTQVVPDILSESDPEAIAKALSDSELISKVEDSFRNLTKNIPYIREARDRFSQPGRRVPVDGNPTWTEWVETHLGVGIRRIQQLLAEPKARKEKSADKSPEDSQTELKAEITALKAENANLRIVAKGHTSGPTWQCQGERDQAIRYFIRHSKTKAGLKHEVEKVLHACGWRVITLEIEQTETKEDKIRADRERLAAKEDAERKKDQEKARSAKAAE